MRAAARLGVLVSTIGVLVVGAGLVATTAAAATTATTPFGNVRATFASAYRAPSTLAGSAAFDPSNSTASGYASTSMIQVDVGQGQNRPGLYFFMQAPYGQSFRSGTDYPGDDANGDHGLGQVNACNGVAFTVLDLASSGTTITRLDMTFRTACPEDDDGYGFGELEIGEPASSPGATLSAAHLSWPVDPVGLTSPANAPVRVVNTGAVAESLGAPTLTGDTTDFAVVSTCTSSLAAHASCQLTVAFTPRASGLRTATLQLTVGGHAAGVALAGQAPPGRTVLTMTSQAGDQVGLGQTYVITDAQYPFHVTSLDASYFLATTEDGDDQWTVRIQDPRGLALTTGSHVAGPAEDEYHLDVNGNGAGCGSPVGSVTVDQVGLGANGDIDVLDAHFVQRCAAGGPALSGEIAYRATTPDPTPPAAPFILRAGGSVPSGHSLVAHLGAATAYTLTVQADGNLVERDSAGVVWASGTHSPGAHLTMAATGQLRLLSTAGSTVWTLGTAGSGHFAELQTDGNLVVDDAAYQPVGQTSAGQRPA